MYFYKISGISQKLFRFFYQFLLVSGLANIMPDYLQLFLLKQKKYKNKNSSFKKNTKTNLKIPLNNFTGKKENYNFLQNS